MEMPAASASLDGLMVVSMRLNSHITNNCASAEVRKLPRGLDIADPHNANMNSDSHQEINGGPNFIRAWREAKGRTAASVAKAIGTSPGNYSDIENGKRGLSLLWLRRISKALGVPAGILADYAPEQVPPDVFATMLDDVQVAALDDLKEVIRAILDTPRAPRELASSEAEMLAKALQYTLKRLAIRPEIRGNPVAIQEAFASGSDLPFLHTQQ